MAKKSKTPPRRKKTVRRRTSSRRTSSKNVLLESAAAAARDADGCEVDFTQGEITKDADLPPARGGVESVQETRRRITGRR